MEQNFTIKNITKNSTNLEVDWSDGKKSKFNYLWLIKLILSPGSNGLLVAQC